MQNYKAQNTFSFIERIISHSPLFSYSSLKQWRGHGKKGSCVLKFHPNLTIYPGTPTIKQVTQERSHFNHVTTSSENSKLLFNIFRVDFNIVSKNVK